MSISNVSTGAGVGPLVVGVGQSLDGDVAQPRLFSVDEYHRMAETGVFDSEERLELIEGVVCMMSPIHKAHFKSVSKTQKQLTKIIPAGWDVVCQQPLQLARSEPVPDVMVLRGNVEDFETIPQASHVALVIEIADSTISKDYRKRSIYAAAGIPEYWIVNVVESVLEVHRQPLPATENEPARYESEMKVAGHDSVDVVLDGRLIGKLIVNDILP